MDGILHGFLYGILHGFTWFPDRILHGSLLQNHGFLGFYMVSSESGFATGWPGSRGMLFTWFAWFSSSQSGSDR